MRIMKKFLNFSNSLIELIDPAGYIMRLE